MSRKTRQSTQEPPEGSIRRALPTSPLHIQLSLPSVLGVRQTSEKYGHLYQQTRRYEESEAQHLKAISIYTVHFPRYNIYADCLYFLGDLYKEMHRYEAQYMRAAFIYSTYPQNNNFAMCLHGLGCSTRPQDAWQRQRGHYKQLCTQQSPVLGGPL